MSGFNNQPTIIEWHDNPQGFVYTNATEQRILKSNADGFIEPDKKNSSTKVGLVDWTDGVEQITWQGVHRYCEPSIGTKVFKKGHAFEFYGLITGYVCGAAFKNNVFLVFSQLAGELHYYFVNLSREVLGSGIIGSYQQLTQCVAVSPDGTKASFIAVILEPPSLEAVKTQVIDLTINWTVNNWAVAISNTSQPQDTGIKWWVNSTYIPSATTDQIVVAVDYDLVNQRKTFFIKTDYTMAANDIVNHDPLALGILEPQAGTTDGTPEIALADFLLTEQTLSEIKLEINFNDQLSAKRQIDTTRTYRGDVWRTPEQFYNPENNDPIIGYQLGIIGADKTGIVKGVDTLIKSWDWSYIKIDNLDLRHGLLGYTQIVKDGSGYQVVTTETYSDYSGSIAKSYAVTGNLWDFERYGGDAPGFTEESYTLKSTVQTLIYSYQFSDFHSANPLSAMLFRDFYNESYLHGQQANKFFQARYTVFGEMYGYNKKLDASEREYFNTDMVNGKSVFDRFEHKLIQFYRIKDIAIAANGIYSGTYGEHYVWDLPPCLKLDKNNTLYSNSIIDLKGVR